MGGHHIGTGAGIIGGTTTPESGHIASRGRTPTPSTEGRTPIASERPGVAVGAPPATPIDGRSTSMPPPAGPPAVAGTMTPQGVPQSGPGTQSPTATTSPTAIPGGAAAPGTRGMTGTAEMTTPPIVVVPGQQQQEQQKAPAAPPPATAPASAPAPSTTTTREAQAAPVDVSERARAVESFGPRGATGRVLGRDGDVLVLDVDGLALRVLVDEATTGLRGARRGQSVSVRFIADGNVNRALSVGR